MVARKPKKYKEPLNILKEIEQSMVGSTASFITIDQHLNRLRRRIRKL